MIKQHRRKIWISLLLFALILMVLIGIFSVSQNLLTRKEKNRQFKEQLTENIKSFSNSYPFFNHSLRKTNKEIIKVKKLNNEY